MSRPRNNIKLNKKHSIKINKIYTLTPLTSQGVSVLRFLNTCCSEVHPVKPMGLFCLTGAEFPIEWGCWFLGADCLMTED